MGNLTVFALGLVSGALVAILQRVFELFLFRSRLEILDDSPQPGKNLSGHAIRVRNRGKTTAVGCSGLLTIEDLRENDVLDQENVVDLASIGVDPRLYGIQPAETASLLVSPSLFRPIEKELLAWARSGNPIAIDIPPGAQTLLDLCREVHGENPQLQFPSELGWKGLRVALKPADYRIQITVAASNTRPETQRFQITPTDHGVIIQRLGRR